MGKTHNRNKYNKQSGKPMTVTSGGTGKGFIGSNIFTMDDVAIIDDILKNPDWCINDIKQALPYSHSIKNIINFLQTKISPEEINKHSVRTESTKPGEIIEMHVGDVNNKKTDIKQTRWTEEETKIVKTYYPVLGPHSDKWDDLLPNRTKVAIKQRALVNKTTYLTKNDLYAFTPDDDELLWEGYEEIGDDPYEWTSLLTHPHTKEDIKNRIAYLITQKQTKTMPTPKDTPKPVVKTTIPKKEDIMNQNTSISNEQLFQKLRELANTEGVTVTVNIDFGDGLMFVLNDKGDK